MTGIVEQTEREREEKAYKEFLQQLIDGGDIIGAAAGVTKRVIAEGEESLVGGQIYTFEQHVRKPYLHPKCDNCGDSIPWAQAYHALHDGGLCASCEHDADKFAREQ